MCHEPPTDEYRGAHGLQRRLAISPLSRPAAELNKVFPTHWSFLLGEIALYSFVALLITGIYLTLFFEPSMTEVTYRGVYQPLRGVEMSRAYESALTSRSRYEVGCSSDRSPLGRPAFRGVDHGAPGPRLFHRRLPPAA